MTAPIRKKLIEVSIPLEAINKASAREKAIRHGHPSTLHLWWARRPLATCRAVSRQFQMRLSLIVEQGLRVRAPRGESNSRQPAIIPVLDYGP